MLHVNGNWNKKYENINFFTTWEIRDYYRTKKYFLISCYFQGVLIFFFWFCLPKKCIEINRNFDSQIIYVDIQIYRFLNEFYYICSHAVIIITQFYSISISNPQGIPPPQPVSFANFKFLKVYESVSVLQRSSDSTCQ